MCSLSLASCALDDLEEHAAPGTGDEPVVASGSGSGAARITFSSYESASSEAGDQAYFEFALTDKPQGPVVISLGLSDATEARVSPSFLVFTPNSWSTPQSVEVQSIDDDRFDGDVNVYVLPSVTSSDPRYADFPLPALDVLSVDDDYAVTGYRVYALHPDPTESRATALNNRGQAIVEWRGDGHDIHPFLWESPVTLLVDLAATNPPLYQAHALDLNDAGIAVGWTDAAPGQWVMYRGNTILPQPGEIWAINDRNHMAGEALFVDGRRIAIAGDAVVGGRALNNADHVAGLFPVPPYAERAFFWNGTFTDLGSFGGPRAEGSSVNQHDEVVGRMFDAQFNYQPFYYDGTQVIRLGNLSGSEGGWANAINNRGEIVGTDVDLGRFPVRAWIGRPGDLVALDTLLVDAPCFFWIDAKDINDRGEIIVDAVECNTGTIRGYILEPIKQAKPGCTP
ncbi:MAG TPA: hypothetical protein VFQ53_35995 [Kofleriaceae bacterium]|nr:hypothetical protein [Kofleriaceae bacterium]